MAALWQMAGSVASHFGQFFGFGASDGFGDADAWMDGLPCACDGFRADETDPTTPLPPAERQARLRRTNGRVFCALLHTGVVPERPGYSVAGRLSARTADLYRGKGTAQAGEDAHHFKAQRALSFAERCWGTCSTAVPPAVAGAAAAAADSARAAAAGAPAKATSEARANAEADADAEAEGMTLPLCACGVGKACRPDTVCGCRHAAFARAFSSAFVAQPLPPSGVEFAASAQLLHAYARTGMDLNDTGDTPLLLSAVRANKARLLHALVALSDALSDAEADAESAAVRRRGPSSRVDLSVTDERGDTALHVAVRHSQVALRADAVSHATIRAVVTAYTQHPAAHALLNAHNKDLETPLHVAVAHGDAHALALLCAVAGSRGLDVVSARDGNNHTPQQLAAVTAMSSTARDLVLQALDDGTELLWAYRADVHALLSAVLLESGVADFCAAYLWGPKPPKETAAPADLELAPVQEMVFTMGDA